MRKIISLFIKRKKRPDAFSVFFTEKFLGERTKILEEAAKGAGEDQRQQSEKYEKALSG